MAVAVYFLNREMPLEGGLYEWARGAFGDGVGFMVAWNIWAYALSSIATPCAPNNGVAKRRARHAPGGSEKAFRRTLLIVKTPS